MPGNDEIESVSPFCLKVIYALDLMGAHYKLEVTSPRDTPRGKLPCLIDDGECIPDSANIIAHVKNKTGRALFEPSDATLKAMARAVTRVAEDSFYWVVLCAQFRDDDAWEHHKLDVQKVLPAWLRPLLLGVIRKSTLKAAEGAGIGRLPFEEIYQRGADDLDAFLGLMGDRPFLCGDEPTLSDVTMWANIACLHNDHAPAGAKRLFSERPAIDAWLQRLSDKRERAAATASDA